MIVSLHIASAAGFTFPSRWENLAAPADGHAGFSLCRQTGNPRRR